MRRRQRRNRPLVIALYLNALLLAALLIAVLSRGNGSSAFAAPNGLPQIAGGNGMYLMPAQFAQYNWGCYLFDTDKETLCAYEYMQGTKELKLVAARYVHHDRELKSFNTTPLPEEIKRINEIGKAQIRGQEPPAGLPPVPPNVGDAPKNGDLPNNVVPPRPFGPDGTSPSGPATRPAEEPKSDKPATVPNFVPSVKEIQE